MVAAAKGQPVIRLYPYQQAFFADRARVQVAIWCRQAGKDFTTACKAIDDALRTHQAWYIVSVSQRQADATFAKCKQVAAAFRGVARARGGIIEDAAEYDEYMREIDHNFRCTARTLHLPGGGSVTALPGRNPDTLAGLTGNVIFTEFALFPEGGYNHWRVVFPLSTRGFRVVVLTTPRGKNHKAFELANDPKKYSVHAVDIYRAVADGMPMIGEDGRPTTIEHLKDLYADDAGWRREYLCEFTGDMEALVSWAKLVAAGEAGRGQPFEAIRLDRGAGWKAGQVAAIVKDAGRVDVGWDVARRSDLSSVWVNVRRPDHGRALRLLILMRQCEFALQREVICELMRANRVAFGIGDSTGLGMDSNETLTTMFGRRWEGLDFSGKSKRELGSLLRTTYDDASQAIPPTDGEHKYIATDIYAIQCEGGRDRLTLAESENPLLPESHCDIAYSHALALRAGQTVGAGVHVSVWWGSE